MAPHKHFPCPHCDTPVPATLDELDQAAAVLTCPGCRRHVYLAMGKLSNFQPDAEGYRVEYDDAP